MDFSICCREKERAEEQIKFSLKNKALEEKIKNLNGKYIFFCWCFSIIIDTIETTKTDSNEKEIKFLQVCEAIDVNKIFLFFNVF